jgi:PucR C-terminal helix-turn-helix domain
MPRAEVLRRIVERADLEAFADRMLDSFWYLPEFQRLHPPREQVRSWVRWNLDLVIRWLVEGRGPSEAELGTFREAARARAADGTPADIVPANFRRGARFAWAALLEAASEEERPALLESADLLFEYVDQVSRIFSDVYAQASATAPPDPREAAARALLRRLGCDEPLQAEDHQLAEQIGFSLTRAARPFVIAQPGGTGDQHAQLAARLRRAGALAASEGRRVVGLSNRRLDWCELALDADAVRAKAPPAIGPERGRLLNELRTAVEIAATKGQAGELSLRDYLPELLLRGSPHLAQRIVQTIYEPLTAELARTLDLLVEHGFERGATASALPVHRNTLRDRVNRISQLTGVELDSAEGRGLAWLAWLARRH